MIARASIGLMAIFLQHALVASRMTPPLEAAGLGRLAGALRPARARRFSRSEVLACAELHEVLE
ncbi:MAG: hypothetical protein D6741_09940, partial [Planctomycetota bacterium]